MTLLRQLRTKMNLSESYAANLLECSIDEYRMIESGATKPSSEQSYMLERIFILSSEQLLTEMNLSDDERKIQDLLNFQKKLK